MEGIQRNTRPEISTLLKKQFPGRSTQVDELLRLLGGPFDRVPPVFVYGDTATGKTTVVTQTLTLLRRSHGVVNLRGCCSSPRLFFETALTKLSGSINITPQTCGGETSSPHDPHAFQPRCDNLSDFLRLLPEACTLACQEPGLITPSLLSVSATAAAAAAVGLATNGLNEDEVNASPASPRHSTRPPMVWMREGEEEEEEEVEREEEEDLKAELVQEGMARAPEGSRTDEGLRKRKHGRIAQYNGRRHTRNSAKEDDCQGPERREAARRSTRRRLVERGGAFADDALVHASTTDARKANVEAKRQSTAVQEVEEEEEEAEITQSTSATRGRCAVVRSLDFVGNRKDTIREKGCERTLNENKAGGAAGRGTNGQGDGTVALRLVGEADGEAPPSPPPPPPPTIYLVLDGMEVLLQQPDSSTFSIRMLPVLLRLPEFSGQTNLGLILLSRLDWGSFLTAGGGGCASSSPLLLHFPAYSDDELVAILSRRRPGCLLYPVFVKFCIRIFGRAARSPSLLSSLLDPLWAQFIRPVTTGLVDASDSRASASLTSRLLPLLKSHLSQPFHIETGNSSNTSSTYGSSASNATLTSNAGGSLKGALSSSIGHFSRSCCSPPAVLPVPSLPLSTKHLLLAAYIASRNPSHLDAVFDAAHEELRSGRRRRVSAGSQDKREAQARAQQALGPAPFSFSRLLLLYQSIRKIEEIGEDRPEEDTKRGRNKGESTALAVMEGSRTAVQSQLATLAQAQLVAEVGVGGGGGTDLTVSGARFKCIASRPLVEQVALSVGFPLERYLLYG